LLDLQKVRNHQLQLSQISTKVVFKNDIDEILV